MIKTITKGFSLIELIIALGLMTLLFGIALTNANLLTGTKLQTMGDDFLNALILTRNLAISHNQTISLCKSADNGKCNKTLGFETGWLIFLDKDADGVLDKNDKLLHVSKHKPHKISIRGNKNYKNRITYLPSGTAKSLGRFVICNNQHLKPSLAIFINKTGKARLAPDTDKNRIPEDYNNKDIDSCLTDTTYLD